MCEQALNQESVFLPKRRPRAAGDLVCVTLVSPSPSTRAGT